MIEIKKMKLMPNLILVKPEKDHDTYQLNGRETGIINSLAVGTAGQRMNVYGTVLSVCEGLRFTGKLIDRARKNLSGGEVQTAVDLLKRQSVLYDVPMELKEGDKIMYFYKNQIDAFKEAKVLYDTDAEVPVMLMKYDNIRAIVRGDDELYPLNANVFIRPIQLKTDKKTIGGIQLLEKKHMGMDVKKAISYGIIVEVGCRCDGYLEFPQYGGDPLLELRTGDIVMYDGRMSRNLEFELHQTMATPRKIIHRKDIYHKVDLDTSKFDFVD